VSDDRGLRQSIGRTIRHTRLASRITQLQLASAVGLSQTEISAIERAIYPDLPLSTAERVLDALDIRIELRLVPPFVVGRNETRDEAHARCVGYVARRLEDAGWQVAREVPVGGSRWRGFIDILAFHPDARLLVIVEIKTEIVDVGEIDRQLSAYEREAWSAAHGFGWRPTSAIGALVLLGTEENEETVRRHRDVFERTYTFDGRALGGLVRSPRRLSGRGQRAIAMIDPRSRRREWLLPTTLDGRRSPARYRDRRDFLRTGRGKPVAPGCRPLSRRTAA
jgi:transcriptional regulator with XRE-family HTH domain